MDRSAAGSEVKQMRTLIQGLRDWAHAQPHVSAVSLLDDAGEVQQTLTFAQLDRAAQSAAATLHAAGLPQLPVLLPAEPTLEFITSLWGCLYAGVIATPVPPLTRKQGSERLQAIIADAGIKFALATGPACSDIAAQCPRLVWIAASESEAVAAARPLQPVPTAPALVQYTSGSTDAPKGVVVTHQNLRSNLDMEQAAFAAGPHTRIVSWLPLYHDMGLIAKLLFAIHCGAQLYLMRARRFVQNPLSWLQVISRYRATLSGAPNFAYELCVRRAEAAPSGLDLSSWKVAFCGAEPVCANTLRRFASTFGPHGFAATALVPCYGLAEATVYGSGGPAGHGLRVLGELTTTPGERASAVSCGCPDGTVVIVDPQTRQRVSDSTEGEIWIHGDHVAAGYWNRGEPGVFGARIAGEHERSYLRTGDLGLLCRGHLFVTGRLKNIIIHRGANLHAEDIESTIAHSDARFGATGAAFGIEREADEQVAAVFEVEGETLLWDERREMIGNAIAAVAAAHGVRLFDLVLVLPGELLRTTSGKVRRGECRAQYLAGNFQALSGRGRVPSLGINQISLGG